MFQSSLRRSITLRPFLLLAFLVLLLALALLRLENGTHGHHFDGAPEHSISMEQLLDDVGLLRRAVSDNSNACELSIWLADQFVSRWVMRKFMLARYERQSKSVQQGRRDQVRLTRKLSN